MESTKISPTQKELLLQFMEEHPDFRAGKFLGVEGRLMKNRLWLTLAENLNACNGPTKPASKWQRVWVDLKNKIKKKAGTLRNHRRGTGGGPQAKGTLTTFEDRVVALLTEEAVHGLEDPDGLALDSEGPEPAEPSMSATLPTVPTDYTYHCSAAGVVSSRWPWAQGAKAGRHTLSHLMCTYFRQHTCYLWYYLYHLPITRESSSPFS